VLFDIGDMTLFQSILYGSLVMSGLALVGYFFRTLKTTALVASILFFLGWFYGSPMESYSLGIWFTPAQLRTGYIIIALLSVARLIGAWKKFFKRLIGFGFRLLRGY